MPLQRLATVLLMVGRLFPGCGSGTVDGDVDADTEAERDTDRAETEADGGAVTDGDVPEATESEIDEEPLRCNGIAAFCGRRYDELAYPTTHNSMSNRDDRWVAPNQEHPIAVQLADGIRGFMLDVYLLEGEAWLCHGDCIFGQKPLIEALSEMDAFLEANPGEVVTIIFESYVDAGVAAEAFETSGLLARVHSQTAEERWPTLGEMVSAGRQVVVFTDNGGGDPDWYHPVWAWAWDNDWNNHSVDDFDCRVNRGDAGNELFILNHFLYGAFDLPSRDLARVVNANPFFRDRVAACRAESGAFPNFVTVDFYSVGDLFHVVDELNSPSGVHPRTLAPSTVENLEAGR